MSTLILTSSLLAIVVTSLDAATPPPLIPRSVLFANPRVNDPVLSPDGLRLAWCEADAQGRLRPRVVTLGARDTVSYLETERADVQAVEWAGDGRHLLYRLDQNGDENWHLWALDTRTGKTRDLTPFRGVRAEDFWVSAKVPNEVLVGLNRRDARLFDVHRIDLTTGKITLEATNPGHVVSWAVDRDFKVRAAVALDPRTSDTILLGRSKGDTAWRALQSWAFANASSDRYQRILGFRADGEAIYVQHPIARNTTRISELPMRGMRERELTSSNPEADIWNIADFAGASSRAAVLLNPRTGRPEAWATYALKPEWKAIDAALAPDLEALGAQNGGVFQVVSRDTSAQRWVVYYERDTAGGLFVLYERATRTSTPLFVSRPELAGLSLSPMQALRIPARDRASLPCYLTLPVGEPATGLPMVVLVHGGPWHRDEWVFDPMVQWLANRGYAVLQVNFRGSTGFGVQWLNAGDLQLGPGRMLQDVVDAARWVAREGIADSTRMGIMGGSYGGYATLSALAFFPGTFACGIDEVGPSDMKTLISSFPPYWAARKQRWLNRVGDVLSDSTLNRSISPLYHADAIRAPLLIGHGVNDPRVKLAESTAIVKALRARKGEVEFVVYPDEGHGIGKPANATDFAARIERFLATHLKGRAEPWKDTPGTSAQIR
ncbi:MAG: S9 family peptidase [Candidatus Eisenbacteria bacterium]|uniref:S9 family peptidase n=1 Tax=Eiseniibacteriota bacterium TaxID=2212470 RepID=A0A849SJU8_UNCEI|nr:S9 family peptidase [Candidatus Eisenbacteria bacterium]